MKIYFAYTIRGDKSRIHIAKEIVKMLKEKGHEVMTEFFFENNNDEMNEEISDQDIFERDIKLLKECDILVSEVSGSSFGIGYEIGYAMGELDKKAFIFFDKNLKNRISRMATGNTHKNCKVFEYSDLNDIENFIKNNL